MYHITDSIHQFGVINKYIIETYESFHKTFVKNSYRLTNKKNVKTQIVFCITNKYFINSKLYIFY